MGLEYPILIAVGATVAGVRAYDYVLKPGFKYIRKTRGIRNINRIERRVEQRIREIERARPVAGMRKRRR